MKKAEKTLRRAGWATETRIVSGDTLIFVPFSMLRHSENSLTDIKELLQQKKIKASAQLLNVGHFYAIVIAK